MTNCPTCHAAPRQTRRPLLVAGESPPPECPNEWHYPPSYAERIAS